MNRLSLLLCFVCLGCEPRPQPIAVPAKPVPEISIGQPVEPVNPKDINPINNGYSVVIDDVAGTLLLYNHNVLYFQKAQDTVWTPVLKINAELTAYTVKMFPGAKRPSLVFYDREYKGYRQDCLGLDDGIPFFGSIEAL